MTALTVAGVAVCSAALSPQVVGPHFGTPFCYLPGVAQAAAVAAAEVAGRVTTTRASATCGAHSPFPLVFESPRLLRVFCRTSATGRVRCVAWVNSWLLRTGGLTELSPNCVCTGWVHPLARRRWIWRVRHYYDPLYAFTVMLLHFAAAWLLMVLVVYETTRRRGGKGLLPGVSGAATRIAIQPPPRRMPRLRAIRVSGKLTARTPLLRSPLFACPSTRGAGSLCSRALACGCPSERARRAECGSRRS